MMSRALLTLLLGLVMNTASAQLLPEPHDGDIRVVYWDLTNETEVFLTLELRSPNGETLPTSLRLSAVFPGKRIAAAPTHVQVRTYVNNLWAPEPRLRIVLDGREEVVFAHGPSGMHSSDSDGAAALMGMAGTIPIAMLRRLVSARSVAGNVLRLEFELSGSQRDAIARFAERILSPDAGLMGGRR
jgi:hypothetical protein